MTNAPFDGPLRPAFSHELHALEGNWLWFVILGMTLVGVGGIALSSMAIASLATALAIGLLLLVGGAAETIGSFWCRGWSGFFLVFLSGLLSIVLGLMFFRAPERALTTLTLLIAFFLIAGGLFKVVSAMNYRFAAWGWPMISGLVDLILGAMIWQEWPGSSFWVIGLFVGINLIFRGVNWIALGLAFRRLPGRQTRRDGSPSSSLASAIS